MIKIMGGSMFLIGVLILVLDIIALVDVLSSHLETLMKLIWTLLILCMPVVGMVLYFLIGKR